MLNEKWLRHFRVRSQDIPRHPLVGSGNGTNRLGMRQTVWEWDELSASYLDLFVVDGEFEIRERLSWNDPGVSEHLGSCPPLHGVYVQHAEDKVLGWGRNWVPVSSGETDFALTNPRQNLLRSVLRTSCKGSAAKGGRVTVYNAWTITDGFHPGRATSWGQPCKRGSITADLLLWSL